MSVRIRLQRYGVNKKPFYRVVAINSKNSRDGKFLEILGTYEPLLGDFKIDDNKFQSWLSKGAYATLIVKKLVNKKKKNNNNNI